MASRRFAWSAAAARGRLRLHVGDGVGDLPGLRLDVGDPATLFGDAGVEDPAPNLSGANTRAAAMVHRGRPPAQTVRMPSVTFWKSGLPPVAAGRSNIRGAILTENA